jgi:hypothetical protein
MAYMICGVDGFDDTMAGGTRSIHKYFAMFNPPSIKWFGRDPS